MLTIDYSTPHMNQIEFVKSVTEYSFSLQNSEKSYTRENLELFHRAIEAVIALFGGRLGLDLTRNTILSFSTTFKMTHLQSDILLKMAAIYQVRFLDRFDTPDMCRFSRDSR